MARTIVDKIGQRFGLLLVLKRSENLGGRVYWECLCECGNISYVASTNLGGNKTQTKSCGCLRKLQGNKSSSWRGGRYKDSNGYIRIFDREHPNRQKDNRVLEHVKVMGEHIGRPLVTGENVHHINGLRDDNRIENLELWTYSQPSGQRSEDLVPWAEEILRKYAPNKLK